MCVGVCWQVLDSITNLASEINNTIEEKLPIIISFNNTLQTVIQSLSVNASATLTQFRSQVSDFSSKLSSLQSILHTGDGLVVSAGQPSVLCRRCLARVSPCVCVCMSVQRRNKPPST